MHYVRLFVHLLITTSLIVIATPAEARKRLDVMRKLYAVDFTKNSQADNQYGFTMEGEFGFILSNGNTDATSIKGKLNARHEMLHWSNRYVADGLYTKGSRNGSEKRATAQRLYLIAQADYKLKNELDRIFIFADYEDDRFNAFNYQASIASGWASILWRDNASSLRYSVGPGYNLSERKEENTEDGSGLIMRASAEYEYKWNSGAKLRQYLSTVAGQDNTRYRSETAISANVFDALAMKLSFKLDHNSAPREDDASLNTETSVTLVYQFF